MCSCSDAGLRALARRDEGRAERVEDADGLAAFEFSRRAGGCGLDEIRRERDAGAQGECRIGGGNAGRAPKAIGRRVCGGLT